MTGVEYQDTETGTRVLVDGESIGTFPTVAEAQRATHRFLQGIPVLAEANIASGIVAPD